MRLTKPAKERIETAALLSCQTTSEFVSSVLLREAEQVIERNRVTYLSEEHWKRFWENVNNPPPLTEHMIRVLEEGQKHTHHENGVTYIDAEAFSGPEFTEGGDPH